MVEVTTAEVERVLERLRAPEPSISSKYHYDETGSRLFEQITGLEEYYLTRAERALLERWAPELVSDLGPRAFIELGAGSAEKSRVILDAMAGQFGGGVYVPVDVSGAFLRDTADALRAEYDTIEVHPLVADMLRGFELDADLPRPRLVALLGSTLGNFERPIATRLLLNVARVLTEADRFLLGVDLRAGPEKPVARVEAAYNDEKGVTARFSLNILNVLNDRFGSDFDVDGFTHRSRYSEERGRIETSLVALRDQAVSFPGEEPIVIPEGTAIRSEISTKYDRTSIDGHFDDAGLAVDRWITDDDALYAIVVGRLAD